MLNEKLEKLLLALNEESLASSQLTDKKSEKDDAATPVGSPVESETEISHSQPKKVSFN